MEYFMDIFNKFIEKEKQYDESKLCVFTALTIYHIKYDLEEVVNCNNTKSSYAKDLIIDTRCNLWSILEICDKNLYDYAVLNDLYNIFTD